MCSNTQSWATPISGRIYKWNNKTGLISGSDGGTCTFVTGYRIVCSSSRLANNYYLVNYKDYGRTTNTTYSAGSLKGIVYNANSSKYPSNGYSGGYYYISKGVE